VTFANSILRHDPLLIEPRILSAFITKCGTFSETLKELFGEPPQARVENGIGILPVSGIIGQGLLPIEKMFGATDTGDLSATLNAFATDPNVQALLLDIDSPGGTVTGIPEVADQIAGFPKPTYAFCSNEACSAAYWLGSQANEFLCTRSATVGSVGVYLAILDSSVAFAQAGIFVDLIKAGTYKAAGFPGTSLTDNQRALLQERVDQIHALFKSAVTSKRSYVRESSLEGQSFYGAEAAKRNLVTGLVSSRASLLDRLTSIHGQTL
jgi:signal peptide peptidase SppA